MTELTSVQEALARVTAEIERYERLAQTYRRRLAEAHTVGAKHAYQVASERAAQVAADFLAAVTGPRPPLRAASAPDVDDAWRALRHSGSPDPIGLDWPDPPFDGTSAAEPTAEPRHALTCDHLTGKGLRQCKPGCPAYPTPDPYLRGRDA